MYRKSKNIPLPSPLLYFFLPGKINKTCTFELNLILLAYDSLLVDVAFCLGYPDMILQVAQCTVNVSFIMMKIQMSGRDFNCGKSVTLETVAKPAWYLCVVIKDVPAFVVASVASDYLKEGRCIMIGSGERGIVSHRKCSFIIVLMSTMKKKGCQSTKQTICVACDILAIDTCRHCT